MNFRNNAHYQDLRNSNIVATNIVNTKKVNTQKVARGKTSHNKLNTQNKTSIIDTVMVENPDKAHSSESQNLVATEMVNTQHVQQVHQKRQQQRLSKKVKKITGNSELKLESYLDKKHRTIYIHNMINSGSYNDIYAISLKSNHTIDPKIIIRVSNTKSNSQSIKLELKGIKTQYKLALQSDSIGRIVDYGKLKNCSNEYSIIEKYGLSLREVLKEKPKYQNVTVILKFMHQFLYTIECIHRSNYAHLDLKPSNILLRDIKNKGHQIFTDLDFALVDFGASQVFRTSNSKNLKAQMASAAFSPPELLKYRFGKKSDIWSYGVICYLVCVGCFFFEAGASQIFMGTTTKKIMDNIHKALRQLPQKMVPHHLSQKSRAFENYFGPLNGQFHILSDFFAHIFVEEKQRPSAQELLQHPLFKFLKIL